MTSEDVQCKHGVWSGVNFTSKIKLRRRTGVQPSGPTRYLSEQLARTARPKTGYIGFQMKNMLANGLKHKSPKNCEKASSKQPKGRQFLHGKNQEKHRPNFLN